LAEHRVRDTSGRLAGALAKPRRFHPKPAMQRVETAASIVVDCTLLSAVAAIPVRPQRRVDLIPQNQFL